ncbi:hypothetical protein VCHC62B1_1472B, partial [Vibrio cholerae HC-62B1]
FRGRGGGSLIWLT